MTDPELRDLIYQLDGANDLVGAIVYGSHAAGHADASSDIDLVLVTRDNHTRQFIQRFGTADLDVFAGPGPMLEKRMESDDRTNNNFILFAFAHGRGLFDRDGGVEQLLETGRRRWENGPVAPSQDEQRQLRAAVAKSVYAAARLTKRATQSLEWQSIAQIQCGYLFMQCVYGYCRANRLWSSAMWEMLKWSDPRYTELLGLCRSYLNSRSAEERFSALERIAKSIFAVIDSSTRQELANVPAGPVGFFAAR
jgi:Nucleotidyltransferase domain